MGFFSAVGDHCHAQWRITSKIHLETVIFQIRPKKFHISRYLPEKNEVGRHNLFFFFFFIKGKKKLTIDENVDVFDIFFPNSAKVS